MELLLMLELVYMWRLQREYSPPKQEKQEHSEDTELSLISYPKGENTCVAP
jgi:hypothetical protein